MTKGYKQKPSIDYFKVFLLVVKINTVCILISLATQNNQKNFQIDIKFEKSKGGNVGVLIKPRSYFLSIREFFY